MQLTIIDENQTSIRAGYDCPCGCTPAVTYARGGDVVQEGCCCGNEFAVGSRAGARLVAHDGFVLETQAITAPWSEELQAAWLVGPSKHAASSDHDTHAHAPDEQHDHEHSATQEGDEGTAIDPVCGMTVERATAESRGLYGRYGGSDYHFCGKGCKLEFEEDPERFLDASYVPSM